MRFRWIISPGILEIHTNFLPIRGFSICKYNQKYNSELLKNYTSGAEYIYKCKINDVNIQNLFYPSYQYYYYKKGWYIYTRKIGFLQLKFSYNPKTKTFKTNRLNALIPFEFGQIWPIGLHLSNIIAVDFLLEKNLLFIHGSALEYKNKIICIFSPFRTGKTTLIQNMLKKGAKYMSDDVVLTDGKKIYLIPPNSQKLFDFIDLYNSKKEGEISEILFNISIKKQIQSKVDTALSLLRIYSKRIPYESDKFIQAILYYHNLNFKKIEEKCYHILLKLIKNSDIKLCENFKEICNNIIG